MKKFNLIAVLVLSIALVFGSVIGAGAISKTELLETTYAFDQILFGSDEVNGFTFCYFDKADNTIKPCVYLGLGESPWNPGLDMYTGPTEEGESEGYEYIIMNYTFGCPTIHPSKMGNTGCAFTCPYTGTINIMTYFRVGTVLPDSSELSIYKNSVSDDTLLFRVEGQEDGSQAEYTVEGVEVTAGDIIYWFDDCLETTASDSADFNPRVIYTAVNDENVTEDEPAEDSSEEESSEIEDTDAPEESTEDTAKGTEEKKDTKPADTKPADNGGKNSNLGLIIGIIAALIVIAAVVIIIVKKKK